jgi:tetraacyldisaccharide 4'-kinase
MASPLGRIYGLAARWRRRTSTGAGYPRRLRRPVISVGSLTMGGAGKTPLVAHLARLLLAAGERPAILSRGYARRTTLDGVVVVREPGRLRGGIDESGDEPLMLAEQLPGCAVLVAEDRHLAGALAESRLDCTVHLLDDGFQHVQLARDLDVLLVRSDELTRGRVVPAGALREPPAAAARAHAWMGEPDDLPALRELAARAGVRRVFTLHRAIGAPAIAGEIGGGGILPPDERVLLVAGIARPEPFERDVRGAGWNVVDCLTYADHHPYTRRDVLAIRARAAALGASIVMTTEKDAVRLTPLSPLPFVLASVPLTVSLDADEGFSAWLAEALAGARRGRRR